MRGAKEWAWAIGVLWLAAGLQMGVMPSFSYGLFAPDILFATCCVVCFFATRRAGAFFGLLAGLYMGAIIGVNMASLMILRMFAGLAVAWMSNVDMDRNPNSVALLTGLATLFVQLVTLFIAPKPAIGSFLLATIAVAVVNGVLAMPIYAFLNRFMDPARR